MKKIIYLLSFLLLSCISVFAQQDHEHHLDQEAKGFRLVGIIGHTLVNNEGLDNVFVPSWGLDIEYWFNHKWGLGLHNDIEIATFIIKNSENEEIERINPLVLTLDALYHFGSGFVFTLGPGVELEREKSFYLMRIGFEYEHDLNESFYILPNLFLDQRFDGYNSWNIGLGVGYKL